MAKGRIGLRDIARLSEGQILWDGVVRGFGARRQKGPSVTYIVKYRNEQGRQRWYTIGRHGAPWTPDQAREEALRILGRAYGATGQKHDPAAQKRTARHATRISELCDVYMADALAGRLLTRRKMAKRAATLATDRGRIEGHIKPLLGQMAVAAVTVRDVQQFMHDIAAKKTARKGKGIIRKTTQVRGGSGAATRTVGLLGAIFTYAVQQGMRSDNPVRGVVRFADRQRERRLSDEEYAGLGKALASDAAQAFWPPAVAATRLLAVTGWRRQEVLGLKWSELDLAKRLAILEDTKTGRSMRPLSRVACEIINAQPKVGEFVFPSIDGNSGMTGFPQFCSRKLERVEGCPKAMGAHLLRHSFASIGNDLGFSDSTIGAIIGHKGRTITSRYIHTADSVLLAATDKMANRIHQLMGGIHESKVVDIRPLAS